MKKYISLSLGLIAIVGISAANSTELTLQQVLLPEVPASLRLEYIERYLQIQRYDWKLTVPKGYRARLTFRQKSTEKSMLELDIDEGTTTQLFLAHAPDRSQAASVTISFGNEKSSVTTFMAYRDGWQVKFGNPGGDKDNFLFQIWNPLSPDVPQFWCETLFEKK